MSYDAQKDIRAVVAALAAGRTSPETAAASLFAVVLLAERHGRADGRDLGIYEAAEVVRSQVQRSGDGLATRALVAASRRILALAHRGADGTYRPDAITGAHPNDERTESP